MIDLCMDILMEHLELILKSHFVHSYSYYYLLLLLNYFMKYMHAQTQQ